MQVLKMVAKTDSARKVQVSIALNESSSLSSSSPQNVQADPTIAFTNTTSTGYHHQHNNNNDTIGQAHLLSREVVIPSTDPLIPSKTCNVSLVYPVIFGQKPSHHNVSDLFRGHGGGLEDMEQYSNKNNSHSMDKAICEFAVTGQAFQMAHGMQQLYRCIAWWREHPNLPWVLVWKKDPRKGLNRYMTGMVEAYRDVLNVTIVQDETDEPRVTALISQTTRSVKYTHYAMRSPDDAAFLRDAILTHYQLLDDRTLAAAATTTTTGGCRPEKLAPVIGILDRRENRKLLNVHELASRLKDELGVPTTQVTYFEDKTFLEQLKFMSQVDILLSSHGAQLVSIPFMPRCGGIMEFFQRGYFLSYYFGSLAAMSNLTYSYLYTGWNTTLERRQARGEYRRQRARERNICLNVDAVLQGVHTLIERWKGCCGTGENRSQH
jgi:hypothetical protein